MGQGKGGRPFEGGQGARNPGPAGGSETILLVEDELRIRVVIRSVLRQCGYQVMDASSADEALAIFRERWEQIHLVLTDVMLAKTTAPQLIDKVHAMCPQMKVLLMSGYAGEAVVHQGFSRPDIPFIQKPFSVNDLARKVRDVLESPPLAH